MKAFICKFRLGHVVLLLIVTGCSKSQTSDSRALKGAWKGQEISAKAKGSASLVFSGKSLEFHGADTNEWYKDTFSLREDTNPKQLVSVITECPLSQYGVKTVNATYRIENGTLMITGNEPGNPAMPAAFDAPGARQIVFKAEKP